MGVTPPMTPMRAWSVFCFFSLVTRSPPMGVTPPMTPMRVWSVVLLPFGHPQPPDGCHPAYDTHEGVVCFFCISSLVTRSPLLGVTPPMTPMRVWSVVLLFFGQPLPPDGCHPAYDTHEGVVIFLLVGSTWGAPGEQFCLWRASPLVGSLPGSNSACGESPGRNSACGKPPGQER